MKKNMKKVKKEPKINLMQWLMKLKPYEMEFLREYKMVEYEEERNFLIDQLDMCYSAALIEDMDLPLDQIECILQRATFMLGENADMLKEYGRRDYYMKLAELEKQVKEKMMKMLVDGCKQNEIIKICKAEFKVLKASHVNNAYKKVLEEYLEVERERNGDMGKNKDVMDWLLANQNKVLNQDRSKTIKELVNEFDVTETTASTYYYRWKKQAISKNSVPAEQKKHVALENNKITNAKAKAIAEKVAAELEEELASKPIPKNEAKEEAVVTKDIKEMIEDHRAEVIKSDLIKAGTIEGPKSNLTVISRSLVVKGKYGDYILGDDGLKVGEFTFTDRQALENYYKQEIQNITNKVNEYREVFNLA